MKEANRKQMQGCIVELVTALATGTQSSWIPLNSHEFSAQGIELVSASSHAPLVSCHKRC